MQSVYDNYVKEVTSINEQIAKLEKQKLKEQLNNDLATLKSQKTMLDKLKSIANELRFQVYGSSEIEALYNSSLEQVKKDYAAGNAESASFNELQKAATAKTQNIKDSSTSAEQYRFEILKLANQIQSVAPKEAYESIDSKIDKANLELKKIEDVLSDGFDEQIKALKDNLAAITMNTASTLNSNKDLFATLGGTFSTSFNALANGFNSLANSLKDSAGNSLNANVGNINVGGNTSNNSSLRVTANGGILTSAKDEYVNSIYLRNFGRSAEDYGLRYWSDSSLTGKELEDAMVYAGTLNGENTSDFLKKNNLKPFADGGIVTRPTAAMIGEAGYPEAIIPLQGGRGVKVDMDGQFEALAAEFGNLSKKVESQEQLLKQIAKNSAELNFNFKNVIDENGERLLTKAAG